MNKQELTQEIQSAYTAMREAVDGLPQDAYLRPGVCGMWSVKDVLAHITIWYSELITALSRLHPNRVPKIVEVEDIDDFNEEQYRANVRRGLDVILEDFEGVHKHLIKMVESIDEKLLTNARRFTWMEGEPLWYLIAENGFWHEKEHADDIKRWREENGL